MAKEAADKPVVGVDLGGTKVLAGVVDRDYKILATAKRATKGEMGVERGRRAHRQDRARRDPARLGLQLRRPGRRLLAARRAR